MGCGDVLFTSHPGDVLVVTKLLALILSLCQVLGIIASDLLAFVVTPYLETGSVSDLTHVLNLESRDSVALS